jgi:hypothetical protein
MKALKAYKNNLNIISSNHKITAEITHRYIYLAGTELNDNFSSNKQTSHLFGQPQFKTRHSFSFHLIQQTNKV